MSTSERGGKEKRELTMIASDETFLFHIVSVCFGGCVVESAWLWDLAPCDACTQTSQNWSFEVEKREKSVEESLFIGH